MEITFLGTGTSQGIPVIACGCGVCKSTDTHDKRLRTSIMISHHGKNIVVDAGPDFRQQMLRVGAQTLEAVVFTHEHKDHTAGLDDVRAFNFVQKKPMLLYGDENVEACIKRDYHYAFGKNTYPGVPRLDFNLIENRAFDCCGLTFTPILVWHYKLPVFGFRVGDFTYITDAKTIGNEELEKIKGSKVLVLNALRKEEHVSHFNIDEALAIVDTVKPRQCYFTHISHLMGKHEAIEQELPDGVNLAYDGLKIDLG